MIRLTCASCKTVLNIDDGFAGGVCRCQHCGAIQTVPRHAAAGAGSLTSPVPQPMGQAQKTLYQGKTQEQGSGLDQLATAVVTSSGLSGTGLSGARIPAGRQPSPKPVLLIAIVVVVAAAAALVTWLALRSGDTPRDAGGSGETRTDGSGGGTPVRAKGPAFLGVKLQGPTIVYVLDRGNATRDLFGTLKEGCLRSIESLGAENKFQVIFWEIEGSRAATYPPDGPAYATRENAAACEKSIGDINAYGRTELAGALRKALALGPSEVLVASAKDDIEDADLKAVLAQLDKTKAKIHTFSLGTGGPRDAFGRISARTGGAHQIVPVAQLVEFGAKNP